MNTLCRTGLLTALSSVLLALAAVPSASAQSFAVDEASSAVLADVERSALVWLDLDGDGDPDLVVTGLDASGTRRGEVYRNEGGALVLDAANSAVVPDVSDGALAVADYDGDGDPDLVLTGIDGAGVRYGEAYRNEGGLLVRDAESSENIVDVSGGNLSWGDFDGDGDLDLALGGHTTPRRRDAVGYVYKNYRGRLGGPEYRTLWGASPAGSRRLYDGDLGWADYDGDGDLDLTILGFAYKAGLPGSGRSPISLVETLRNTGGQFRPGPMLDKLEDGALAWADYDGDGDPDLAYTGRRTVRGYRGPFAGNTGSIARPTPEYVGVFRPNTGAQLAPSSTSIAGVDLGELAWGDYDGDGDLDLALTGLAKGADNALSEIYRNDGGALVRDDAASAALRPAAGGSLAWADVDGDGDLDLAVTGRDDAGEPFGMVFRNGPPGPSAAPVADAGPDQTMSCDNPDYSLVQFDGSSSSDPDGGWLTYVWSEGGAELGTGRTPEFQLPCGRHTLTLTVTDPSGRTAADEVEVALTPALVLTLRPVPVTRPFVHVDPGESFRFNYNLDNRTEYVLGGDGGFVVTDPNGAEVLRGGPVEFLIRQSQDRSWRLLVDVPADAAPGEYTLAGYLEDLRTGRTLGTDSLTFRVRDTGALASAGRTASGASVLGGSAWGFRDADTGLPLSSALAAQAEGEPEEVGEAAAFALGTPYPNPTAGSATVPYGVSEAGAVRLAVYDVLGREVARLVDGVAEAGGHRVVFETAGLPAGAYVVRLEAGGAVATARLVVVR
ncbi:FG-GAP-like repeat-containing protein [Rubrivirga marina]|uniref:PKD/Chitinase domain-containing protein n=1 Tax=Rubrivirga marina TaxID=1196024 RepID=A0A271IZW0_9BACT|nr:FG-GAP-like repeat-containing protein [Rubrivirga marina]PAP76334.1 hypothetical protein BSZ37_07695 [Rubrivirga marina]